MKNDHVLQFSSTKTTKSVIVVDLDGVGLQILFTSLSSCCTRLSSRDHLIGWSVSSQGSSMMHRTGSLLGCLLTERRTVKISDKMFDPDHLLSEDSDHRSRTALMSVCST